MIHDGLLARAGVAKVYWQEMEEIDEQEFTDLTEAELDMLLASDDNIELLDSTTDDAGLINGTIGITRDTSQVMIEAVAPEEFLIEAQAKSMMDAKFCGHQTRKTMSELEMGFTEEQLKNIGEHDDVSFETDPEVLARHEDIENARGFDARGYQEQVWDVLVIEAYMVSISRAQAKPSCTRS